MFHIYIQESSIRYYRVFFLLFCRWLSFLWAQKLKSPIKPAVQHMHHLLHLWILFDSKLTGNRIVREGEGMRISKLILPFKGPQMWVYHSTATSLVYPMQKSLDIYWASLCLCHSPIWYAVDLLKWSPLQRSVSRTGFGCSSHCCV